MLSFNIVYKFGFVSFILCDLFFFSLKQTSQSLGIMIIEGKHAEVGQGIFISDIQEGSAAEKVWNNII